MAYDAKLADRIRRVLAERTDVSERKMFGGLCFMVGEHMSVGIVGSDLMVRVGPDQWETCLAKPHATVMDFTGRPMKGFVYVDGPGISTAAKLRTWVDRGVAYADSLPPKKKKAKKKGSKARPRPERIR
jgi:TfoX/Sxy family transcriptional regulator of competence genes